MHMHALSIFQLQKIYVVLDEPDGVAGVAAMRTSEPSLSEQILQYESTGECVVFTRCRYINCASIHMVRFLSSAELR